MMKLKQNSRKWIPFFALLILFLATLACGTPSNEVFPTFDPNQLQTAIAGTAAVAELQTLTASASTNSLLPNSTPEIPSPTFTIAPTETLMPIVESTAFPTLINGALIQIKSVEKEAEYVDLENIGNQPQDLTGWSLVSETGNQSCGLSGVIQPATTFRVWVNNPSGEGYNCNYGSEIWNNSELDPAVLYNNLGQEVARYP